MISSRSRLASSLILACICIPALCQDANNPETQLRFEVSQEEIPWVRDSRNRPGRGPIKPSYTAEFALYESGPNLEPDLTRVSTNFESILQTSAGRLLSRAQREFLAASDALAIIDRCRVILRHYIVRVYAVSQDDAKKIAEAVVEFLTNKANQRMQFAETAAEELQAKIAEVKEQISQKQAESDAAKLAYEEMKRSIHGLSSDAEAREEAKTTIKEMRRTLNALTVEIAGIEAKLSAVREYESRRSSRRKNLTAEGVAKIEQIQIEQSVELAGASASRDAANEILLREAKFYNLARKADELHNALYNLRQNDRGYEERLKRGNDKLADATPDMLPPKVYENKVTIYPVRVEQ